MDSVKTDEELTSTMGNVLSTSKEEKNDSSDATPTSSTDANTNPKASQTVSDDPISSTSSDTFDQSKTTDMKSLVDEADRAQTEDHVADLLEMRGPNEKITEDVEDLVHDLESLLGEPQETFSLPSKKNATCKGDASGSVKIDEKKYVNEEKVEEIENAVNDKKTDTTSNLADTKDTSMKETKEASLEPSSVLPSIEGTSSTDKDTREISESVGENSNTDATSKSTEQTIPCTPIDQITCEQTSQIDPVEVSTQKIETTNPPVDDDADSIGSWELVDAGAISPIPGPSGEPIQAPIDANTAEDISSSGDKASSIDTNQESEENREAEGVQVDQNEAGEAPDEELISDEIREAEPSETTDELAKEAEAATSSQIEETEVESGTNRNADASQNVESPVEITSSDVCSKPETENQETSLKEDVDAAPIEPSVEETKATEADAVPKDSLIEDCSDLVEDITETVPESEEQEANTTDEAVAATKTDVVAEESVTAIEEQEDVTDANATRVEEEEGARTIDIEEKAMQIEEQGAKTDVAEEKSNQVEKEDARTDAVEEITPEVEAEDPTSPKSELRDLPSKHEEPEPQKDDSVVIDIAETSVVDISKSVVTEDSAKKASNLTESHTNENLNETESELKQVDEAEMRSVKRKTEELVDAPETEFEALQTESPTENLNNEESVKASDDVDVEEKHDEKLVDNKDDNNEQPDEAVDVAKEVSEASNSAHIPIEKEPIKLQELNDESAVPATPSDKESHIENSAVVEEAGTVSEKVDPKPILERKQSHLAELEFAPLQLSEDDSDDSEPVPRLALDPDESNSPALPEVNELASEEIADIQPVYVQPAVQPARGVSSNQSAVSMAGRLPKIDGLKRTDSDRIVSEKERKEMEALALAIQSITDSSNSYMDEYIEPVVEDNLRYEANLQEVVQEPAAIEPVVSQEEAAIEAAVPQEEVAIEPPTSQEPEPVVESQNIEPESSEAVCSQSDLKETEPVIPAGAEESKIREESKVDSDAAVVESTETEQVEPVETKNEDKMEQVMVESDQKTSEVVEEAAREVVIKEDKETVDKTSTCVVMSEDNEAVAEVKEVEETAIEEVKEAVVAAAKEAAVNEAAQEKVVDDVIKENASQSSENSQDSINSTNEVLIKEGKRTRSNDKSKKHKKADKYEELTINVDVPDREVTYSPKITIKPIKMPDDEVSTTTTSECEVFKGSLKMTITKQSDKMHSILKISDQDNSESVGEQDEPIPKLIIKPKIQQIESQHSPKMSTRSSKLSPTQRSGSPRITIKPLTKPDKQEPLKIKINTKANAKAASKDDEATRKASIKPAESEQVHSPRITIKPIPKPDSEKEVARLTIKPIKKLEEDVENEDKERSSPKIIIKPVIKPPESEISRTDEDEAVKERIVLKINKGNLPSPAKESKKRDHPADDDKSEKLAKITVKFSKEGGHPHIVHQQGDETSKRSHEDAPSNADKNKKQKTDADVVTSTRSSARHKDHVVEANDKSGPAFDAKTKHKDHHAPESPIETKRPRKDNLNDKSKLLKDDVSDELLSIDIQVDSPIVISEDSRSQDSGSVIPDEGKNECGALQSDAIRTPDRSTQRVVAFESATPSPVLKRGRGRPRKVPRGAWGAREATKPLADESPKPKSKEADAPPSPQVQTPVHESGRPKRSCRGQSVCDTLGIKPRKPRGGGRGRGSKRGMGNRPVAPVAETDPSAFNAIEEEVKVENIDKPSEVIDRKDSKIEAVLTEDEPNSKNTKKPQTKRKSIEKKVEIDTPPIEIDSNELQLHEKEPEINKDAIKKSSDNVEPMDVDDNDKEVEIITKNPKIDVAISIPSTSSDQEATTVDDKRAILKDIGVLEGKPIDVEDKEAEQIQPAIEDGTAIPFQSLAPPSTPKDFSELDSQIIESSSACKQSKEEIPSVSSTTVPSDIMIVDEETRMSAETNSRAQTPAKQVITSSDMVEESQSSVHSTATTESGKTPSRPSKAPRLEVQEPDSQIITADLLSEYYWNGNGPFMLQEQVAQFLGIKSFKRKYPGIMRRMLDMQERDFIREKGLASEHLCDLGLTAVNSADILDIMYSDFQDKYEEYCKNQRDRQAKDLINKQKALSLATSQEKSKADITEQAVHSAAQWNARFNKERKEQRKACMDLQNFAVHYPKGKKTSPVTNPHPGNYPVALVPGQFAEYYKEFTPTELNNLPVNTMCYEEVRFIPRDDSDESGSESDSDSSSSSGSSSCSSSDSDSSSGVEDCKLCKHSPKKSPMSPPPPAVAPPLATAK